MFTNQHHLKHLLRPHHYTSEEQYRAELRHLFQPAWHPLAATSELARPGDFLTFDLLETPIIVRNFDGELRAFLNVCPHRHSRLTDEPRGRAENERPVGEHLAFGNQRAGADEDGFEGLFV